MKVLRWELVRVRAQPRIRVAFALCLLGPPLLALVLGAQTGLPKDTLFGRYVKESGFALPLLILGFAGTWVLPLLTSVVAGDVFATEDGHRTWQALLTRSRTRAEVFAGKVMAAALTSVALLSVTTLSSLAAGLALAGDRPLPGLSGTPLGPGRATALVVASWASELPPLLGFAALAVLLSIWTRSSLAGVGGPLIVGLVMQLLALLGTLGSAANVLLTTPFAAWHGLVRADPYVGPLWQGALVSLAWAVACLVPARRLLLTRDIT
jgi:ABC-2 type transport system permease protein